MFNKTKKPVPQEKPEVARTNVPPPLDLSTVNTKKTAAASVAPIAPTVRNAPSLLAAQIHIDGNITGVADLQIDGNVRGDVKVSHLIVGEAGNIEGSVEADTIEVRGRIVGAISGKQIKLLSSAYVEGDISHETLSIDVGAYFQGRCLQTRRAEAPVAQVSGTSHSFSSGTDTPAMNTYDLSSLSDLK